MTEPTTKLPVTVLTGFLGAGKTTLLNRILTEPHGKKYAVIINEYGEAGIDEQLVTAQVDEEIFEVNNGCICCTVRGDLIRMVNLLMKRRDKFDGLLIETTGLADPAPVAQTFFADPDVRARTRLDSIICLVDAVHIAAQLQPNHSGHAQAREQLAFADTIVLNKIDATPDAGATAKQLIQQRNPFATLLTANHADVPLADILDRGAFDLDRILTLEPSFIADAATGHHHHHADDITSLSLTESKPLDERKFEDWILTLLQNHGQHILRSKGILNLAHHPEKYVFQAVHMMSEGQFTQSWPAGEGVAPPISTFVLIGRLNQPGLDAATLRAAFAACAS